MRCQVWCELVLCLDRQSISFVQSHKPNGVAAWKALVQQYRNLERHRIQKLMTRLTGIKKESNEAKTNYLMRAEEMQMDLHEVGGHMSDAMIKAIVQKGLPREYDNIVTLLNHGEEKEYQAVKLDLVSFANNRSGGENKPKCSNCKRSDHTNADCRQAKEPSIKCYNCGKQGHMAKECRSTKQNPKRRHCNKMGHTDDKCWQKHGGGTSGGKGATSQPASTRIHSGSVSWRKTTGFETRRCGILN
ncbi:uncharacterized protein LOC134854777 [Symsagittifera roscoffensis]|uniref:uncharacterized protein LOC134854777 n=1 Tax=Symsagittifera roscoffensis TaxID=84072 RepID=UPI00307BF1EA